MHALWSDPGYEPPRGCRFSEEKLPNLEASMKTTVFASILLASALVVGTAGAQPYPFSEAGVTNGHWHLNSKDVAANEKILVAMGGKAFTAGARRRVNFPGVMVILDGA